MKVYLMLIVATILGAFGGFFFKKCTSVATIKDIIFSSFLYLVSAVLNIIVLRYLPYSVTLPLT